MALPTLSKEEDVIEDSLPKIKLLTTIGFQGKIKQGLLMHPDKNHIIYAIGHTIIIKNILQNKEYYLVGHTNFVTCVAISKSGRYLASGQETYMGFKTFVILWDFDTRKEIDRYEIHKVNVYSISFSPNDFYLFSLGGEDDGNVVCYNIEKKKLWCGFPAVSGREGLATVIKCCNRSDDIFVTAGMDTVKVWRLDTVNKKLLPYMAQTGQVKRDVCCIEIDANDEFLYCGSTTGDVIKLRLNVKRNGEEVKINPILTDRMERKINKKIKNDNKSYQMGSLSVVCLKTNELLIGAGDGTLVRIRQQKVEIPLLIARGDNRLVGKKEPQMKIITQMVEVNKDKVVGGITSIALRGEGNQFFLGTNACHIYRANLTDFKCELLYTCHDSMVTDLAFPKDSSDVFATSSKETIRIWNIKSSQELLRITVANMTCNAVCFSPDGRAIISGWNDGKIRAHTPQTGKLLFMIHDAHVSGVTALSITSDYQYIVSGGTNGDVRIWKITPNKQTLHESMKEHRASISCIRIVKNDKEFVTSSTDGSCIIWDLRQYKRNQVVYSDCLFQSVFYGAKECQIVTCGSNRKIAFWEVYDGNMIRELEGSKLGYINTMDVTEDGKYFVSGGEDKIIKVWKYQEGEVSYVGLGHSAAIKKLRISPNAQYIVSAGSDGAILIWEFPKV